MSTSNGSTPSMISVESMSRGVYLVIGVSALVLGIVVLVWPHGTLTVIAVLFGIQLVLAGLMRVLVGAFAHDQESWLRAVFVVTGVLVLLLGVACLRNPHLSLGVIVVLVAAGWLVEGILQIVVGAQQEGGKRWGPVVLGGLVVVAAVILLVWPVNSLLVLTRLGGWLLIVIGVMTLLTAFTTRRQPPAAQIANA